MKDTDEQPGEKIHRARSGKVPRAGASVPVELECVTLPVCGCIHHLEALQTPHYWDFMEASSRRHDQLLTPFSAPLPFLENGR